MCLRRRAGYWAGQSCGVTLTSSNGTVLRIGTGGDFGTCDSTDQGQCMVFDSGTTDTFIPTCRMRAEEIGDSRVAAAS